MPTNIPSAGAERSLEELQRELQEAREQQEATAHILSAISSSPFDRQQVFERIVSTAARLCDASNAGIFLLADAHLRLVAHHGSIPTVVPIGQGGIPLNRAGIVARCLLDRQTLHIADAQAEKDEFPSASMVARRLGYRTQLSIPLICAGEAIGVISMRRAENRPFTFRQIELLRTFADQAAIAIENSRLFEEEQTRTRELRESLEYQTITSQVLSVIARSMDGLDPVIDIIVSSAARLGKAEKVALRRKHGSVFVLAGSYGHAPDGFLHIDNLSSQIRRGEGLIGRVITRKATVHVPDVRSFEGGSLPEQTERLGGRSGLGVPLLRDGELIGTLLLWRTVYQPFSPQQIELMETFADQAVIAIENARLLDELHKRQRALEARSAELTQSLEYQTATAKVLSVISASPNELRPALEAILEAGGQLCGADRVIVHLLKGESYVLAASRGVPESRLAELHQLRVIPGRDNTIGRAILERGIQKWRNSEPDLSPLATQKRAPVGVSVPLIHADKVVGVLTLSRSVDLPFDDRQIGLARVFADQAVIAISNAGLFEQVQARSDDLTELLEYQTATSDVLAVISRSPSEVQPALDAIANISQKLCKSDRTTIWRLDGDIYRLAAWVGVDDRTIQYLQANPIAPERNSVVGRVAQEGRPIHIPNVDSDGELTLPAGQPTRKPATMLGVPLMKNGLTIGVISQARLSLCPFTPRQITQLETFADQAVIAIENARLFEAEQARTREVEAKSSELEQSLQYQTAISDVLKVISKSPSDVQPVLDTILDAAIRLCNASRGGIWLLKSRMFEVATYSDRINPDPVSKFFRDNPIPIDGESLTSRIYRQKSSLYIADLRATHITNYVGRAASPARSYLGVPLFLEGEVVGTIELARAEVQPFTPNQIALLKTFADQAVIAIENARLLDELQKRQGELEARSFELNARTLELELASQHKSQFVANMSHELRTPLAAVLGYTELLSEEIYGALPEKAAPILARIQSNGKHLLGLINAVLDIAKIESGQFELALTEYSLASMVETVRVATESLAAKKRLNLKTEVPTGLPVGFADEQRLTQVLLNLVGNAIKFTDVGEVRVKAGMVRDYFTVSVSDTGPGIPPDELERVFEQFHQIDNSNTKTKGGTGLGLAIAKQIVEMHRGRIWVESVVGKGATFSFELPVRSTKPLRGA